MQPKIVVPMSKRSDNIAFKKMPNGNIRAYQADRYDKRGVSELQFTSPENESPTVIAGNTIKVIENMEEKNRIELPEELNGKKFRIRKLTPRECFRLMDVDDADIDKIQAYPFGSLEEHPSYSKEEEVVMDEERKKKMKLSISNSAQYKLAGNSIVVNVLLHIFRKMFVETEPDANGEPRQLSLF